MRVPSKRRVSLGCGQSETKCRYAGLSQGRFARLKDVWLFIRAEKRGGGEGEGAGKARKRKRRKGG